MLSRLEINEIESRTDNPICYNVATMFDLLRLCSGAVLRIFRSRCSLMLENLTLRQQLAVLKRKHPRPRLGPLDKLFWVLVRRIWSRRIWSHGRRRSFWSSLKLWFDGTGGAGVGRSSWAAALPKRCACAWTQPSLAGLPQVAAMRAARSDRKSVGDGQSLDAG